MFSDSTYLLHVAPERNLYRWFETTHSALYVRGDLAPRELINIQIDICQLPFRDESFDFVMCSHVLEHVTDDQAAMRELWRVLCSDGIALLQVPMDINRASTLEHSTIESLEERKALAGAHGHQRTYGRDYKMRLERAGFCVKLIDYSQKLSREALDRYGLRFRAGQELCICKRNSV